MSTVKMSVLLNRCKNLVRFQHVWKNIGRRSISKVMDDEFNMEFLEDDKEGKFRYDMDDNMGFRL